MKTACEKCGRAGKTGGANKTLTMREGRFCCIGTCDPAQMEKVKMAQWADKKERPAQKG